LKYNATTLGSSVDADCRFLENPDHLGGCIELDRLSSFHKFDICVFHTGERNMGPVKSCQATKRIFLLYNGIDYDSVIFTGFGADEMKQVAVDDMRARELAMQMTGVIQTSGGSKSHPTVMMKSNICGKMVKGKREAEAPGKITGHNNFSWAKL
jgi:hypothetical protein